MKDKIIQASIEGLRNEGLKFSVDVLANKLKISKKTVYKYFPDKETLAIALYETYYSDTTKQAKELIGESTEESYKKLLYLYFDSKKMTHGDIFNKYKLNQTLYAYTKEKGDNLWEIIASSFLETLSKTDQKAVRIIVDGSFEKLCSDCTMLENVIERLALLLTFLCISTLSGLLIDKYVFHSFSLNYLLIGMAFSAAVVNIISEKELADMLELYNPILNLSLVIVIVNLGMPLDYRLIAGAGLFTMIYIFSRAIGKIGGAYLGGKITNAEASVTKYLGFTLLSHSGVSLVFTGIAVSTLTVVDAPLATIVSGTIVAAAIINEIIAVIAAKFAFKWAGEINE